MTTNKLIEMYWIETNNMKVEWLHFTCYAIKSMFVDRSIVRKFMQVQRQYITTTNILLKVKDLLFQNLWYL